MSDYRKVLKSRIIITAVCAVLSIAAVVGGMLLTKQAETATSTFYDGFVKGFPLGLFTGFCALVLFYIVRCIRAITNEADLKKMYISEYDERKKAIRQSALGISFFFTSGILVVGLTVVSFYNTIAAMTLAAVLVVHVLAGAIFKLYYSFKY
ncbi:MAG: hypothetical protein CVU91_06790 [Firmicutes bacterium HGW-Firmicutes-16]|nr:MAG: hypothetical protein CVU91_06790 [Firmicutes bacterium HGW-Firmicutes-16]